MWSPPKDLEKKDGVQIFRLGPKPPPKKTAVDTKKGVKPRLSGRVVDYKGDPVGPYRVVAAAMQDPDSLWGNKEYYFAEEAKYIPQGEPWDLTLYGDAKRYWVMAEASGFATAVQVVWHKDIDRAIELRLRPGFSLFGKVEGPGVTEGKAVVMTQPMYLFDSNPATDHHSSSPLHCIQVCRVNVGIDGSFRISNLSPGTHVMQIVAPGATPIERLVTFRDKDIHLEAPLRLKPSGRIQGIVYDRDGDLMVMESCPWAPPLTVDPKVGASIWSKYSSIGGIVGFTTDEKGRFALENAPVGLNGVGFSYNVLIDVIDHFNHSVTVLPNCTTEVRINVPDESKLCWKLPVEVMVGDGSREDVIAGCGITNPKFLHPDSHDDRDILGISLAFEPLENQAVSWPDVDESMFVEIPPEGGPGRAALKGIHPGRTRCSVGVGAATWDSSSCVSAWTSRPA